MKKIFVALAAVLAVTTMTNAADWDHVRLGVDATYPPFESKDSDGNLVGFEIELGEAVCKEMGVTCEWVVQDWDGIIPGLLARKYDAIFSSMSINEDRAKKVLFTEAYYNTPSAYFAKKDSSFDVNSAASMEGLRIGVQRGTIQDGHATDELGKFATIVRYTGADEVILDLFAGRLDAVLIDAPVGQELLDGDSRGSEYGSVGAVQLGEGAAAALRKRDTELAEMFNKALRTVKENGVYDEIRKKFFPYDIKI